MKRLKRIFSIVLVLILTVSILTMPASASLGTQFKTAISNFPTRSTAYSNTFDGYTCVIQRFLWAYDDDGDNEGTRPIIARSGVDGYYGEYTELAVKTFQLQKGLDVDGKTGSATWTEIASLLTTLSTSKTEIIIGCNGYEVIYVMRSYADIDVDYIYFYYTGDTEPVKGGSFYS
ncbi:MAG: peptidoglycan-binding protein [Firmicutes bacterium]|nr:peptidoglycan-binding protein [Bacillota bacterium]